MAICLGQYPDLCYHDSVHNGDLSLDGLQSERFDGMGKRLLYSERIDLRMDPQRHSSLDGTDHGGPADSSSGPSRHR